LRRGLANADGEDQVIRRLGTLAVVVGLGLLAWTGTVFVWKDPFTTAYTAYQQRKLEDDLERAFEEWPSRPQSAKTPKPPKSRELTLAALRRGARRFEAATGPGDAIARLGIDQIELDVVVVEGTDAGNLRKGPGRHLETAMPGEGELVYIAGHRTTYGAPFSRIDRLDRGDAIVL
jgi:sortase A